MPFLVSIYLLILSVSISLAGEQLYAVATGPAPVLNSPDFQAVFGGKDGRTLLTDRCGQIRAVEFVALPGTLFTVEAELKSSVQTVYRVKTIEYPYPSGKGYFIDSRSVRTERERPAERVRKLPSKKEIIATMKSRVGTGYVWGGNLAEGIPQLPDWYGISGATGANPGQWELAGLDCSGLLYEATGGYTPRNTGALVGYGKGVRVAGKGAAAIAALLEPLDLIVWPGHVMIVLDDKSIIESRLVCGRPDEGVRIRRISAALSDVMKLRNPADAIMDGGKEFVIRRWYRRRD